MPPIRLAALLFGTVLTALPVRAQDLPETADPGPAMPDAPALPYLPQNGAELAELLAGCAEDACMSYIAGVLGGITVYAMIAEKPSPICTRGEVDTADVRDAVVTTIKSTPILADNHPVIAILTAFQRYWPCMTQEEIDDLQATAFTRIDGRVLADFIASGNHGYSFGAQDAPAERTLLVFHDPNCSHCQRFRKEAEILAGRGWKVMVYPVATNSGNSEDSAGYGAVEIALRDVSSDAARALYEADIPDTADIASAMRIAEAQGVQTRDILTAIAKSGAYAGVEANTRVLFEIGAKGAPAWIVGNALYSGYLGADSIEALTAGMSEDPDATGAAGHVLPMEN